MASEWGPFHGGSHSTRPVMTFTTFHTHIHTHTLMGPVTAVTFAGAGPQTGRRGPREPQAAIVLSPRKPASLCQTCFSVCFLFYVFNVGKGECFPSHIPPPSSLLCIISPQYPTSSSSCQSIHICFSSFPPSSSSTPFLTYFVSPLFPLEIVICKALCLDSPYLCRGVAASLSLSSFLSILHEVLAQTCTFSSCTEEKTKTNKQCTQL